MVLAGAIVSLASSARGAAGVVAYCDEAGACRVMPVAGWTAAGQNKIRLAQGNKAESLQRTRMERTDFIAKIYRDPTTGEFHKYPGGELALPAKGKDYSSAVAAWDGLSIEYRSAAKSKSSTAIPVKQFVALIMSPSSEDAALELAREVAAGEIAHPSKKALISASVSAAGRAPGLLEWRANLVATMRTSLTDFRAERGDPRLLGQVLQVGLAARETFRLITADNTEEQQLQNDLVSESAELRRSMAVAAALRKAGFLDEFLAKLDRIGLVRWIQPEIAQGAAAAYRQSAADHHTKALDYEAAGLLGKAFDEAQIAANRMPCNADDVSHFYNIRVKYANRNMVPLESQPEHEQRTILEQIVRELDGVGADGTLDDVRIRYFRGRIEEGLRIDPNYLPLQLKKADFLLKIGDLTGSRKVVEEVEREVQLTRSDLDPWLRMEANLKEKQATTRERAENQARESFQAGRFAEALDSAAKGLKADPENPTLLSIAARASAVIRNQSRTQELARAYLRSANPACVSLDESFESMIELFTRKVAAPSIVAGVNRYPHWMSGMRYRLEDVNYDPVSGGFFQPIRGIEPKRPGMATLFRWDGYMVTSIASTRNSSKQSGAEAVLFELEPKYKRDVVYMAEIGMRGNSVSEGAAYKLLYLNSPDFDPTLAEKFAHKSFTRGWAGNPFFHPFLWTGIFLFDFTYDSLGRIAEARPVYPDSSRPRSPFSEILKFTWDGTTDRLMSINGQRYSRVMKYDELGRLKSEHIAYADGKSGRIEYLYQGKSHRMYAATCEDNFFDKNERTVSFHDFGE
jgi:hypothetical protein